MSFVLDHLVSVLVFLPLLAAMLLLAFPTDGAGTRGFAFFVAGCCAAVTLSLWFGFDIGSPEVQWIERREWVPSFGIHYGVGVDGVSLVLASLSTFLVAVVVLSTSAAIEHRLREYVLCLMLLQGALAGACVATDAILFYVFLELTLLPMYFLVGVWGSHRRVYATVKLVVYSSVGSALMLVAILYTAWSVRDPGGLTFDMLELTERLRASDLQGAESWLFCAFCTAFGIKVALFPFHTWFSEASVEAPTGAAVLLSAVQLQVGAYGFLKFPLLMFPEASATYLPIVGVFAVVGILYGALLAMVQSDLKRFVVYVSLSHLGFVILGLCSMTVTGVAGGVVHMVNHGILVAGLLLLVGILQERHRTRELDALNGVAVAMPRYGLVFVLLMLGSLGVPGLNGFVGEFLVLMGTYSSEGMTIDVSTGQLATFACALAGALGVGAVILVSLSMGQVSPRSQIGATTKWLATLATLALASVLLFPPVDDFAGGILVRPLSGMLTDTEQFSEIFAVLAVFAGLGGVLAAGRHVVVIEKLLFGSTPQPRERSPISDLSVRESSVLAPIVFATVALGVYPQPLLDVVTPTVTRYARSFREAAGLPAPPGGVRKESTTRRAVHSQERLDAQRAAEVQRRLPYRILRDRDRPKPQSVPEGSPR